MHQVLIYEILLEAVTPLYFGNGEVGLLSDGDVRRPSLFGNAIGGALKEYLRHTDIGEDWITGFMGNDIEVEVEAPDDQEQEEKIRRRKFIPSVLYISDGRIFRPKKAKTLKREGTAVDPRRGTAAEHKKYEFHFLPEGTLIRFKIECDEWMNPALKNVRLTPEDLEKLIGTWAHGFESGEMLLGGNKNNGFGRVKIARLKRRQFKFERAEDIDRYLFDPYSGKLEDVEWDKLDRATQRTDHRMVFSMEGEFPYGVYQHYESDPESADRTISGLQRRDRNGQSAYYLPSSSVKGVLKHEIRQLLQRIHQNDRLVEEDLAELFGDVNKKGKLRFEDLWIYDHREVSVCRPSKDNDDVPEIGLPVYVKIDRLTGGAYSSALKTQREIQGKAIIRVELEASEEDCRSFRFPILYALRRIGTGQAPLGGRTVVGLGQFFSRNLRIEASGKETCLILDNPDQAELDSLRQEYDLFVRWCERERTQVV